MRKHDTEEDARECLEDALVKASESGRWMAAVWSAKDGRVEMVRKTTFNFPMNQFLAAAGLLTQDCLAELIADGAKANLPVAPLPRAKSPSMADEKEKIVKFPMPLRPATDPALNREQVEEPAVDAKPDDGCVCGSEHKEKPDDD